MQDIRHQCLESHILDTSDHLSRLEVLVRRVTATFPQVVDEIPSGVCQYLCMDVKEKNTLGDLAQRTTFFAEIDNKTDAATLSATDALFNSIYEVRFACANVGAIPTIL